MTESIFVLGSPNHNVPMGFMDAKKSASFARRQLANSGIPLSFSLYRHWLHGMAKQRQKDSKFARTLYFENGEETEGTDMDADLRTARIVQARHTNTIVCLFSHKVYIYVCDCKVPRRASFGRKSISLSQKQANGLPESRRKQVKNFKRQQRYIS